MHLQPPLSILADLTSDEVEVTIGCVCLIGVLIVFYLIVAWLRRRMSAVDEMPASGFTLGDLRQLVRQGKMTAEEYEKARALIVGAVKRNAERQAGDAGQAPNPGTKPDAGWPTK